MTCAIDHGLIEGLYGPLWSMDARRAVIRQLGAAGYGFYHYAPKADPSVREDWRQPYDEAGYHALASLKHDCAAYGMRFGVGLTPLGMELPGETADYRDLQRRLDQLDELAIDELVICFDDTYGSQQDLAARQAELVHWVAARSSARRVCLCPTYYSDAPILDRLFGQRPPNYLAELDRRVDTAIPIYWTGPDVCSETIPLDHIERVAETLGRWPLVWDNYPVNDSPAMANHLHLRAPIGRHWQLAERLAGHAVNPALQPYLSLIPALALVDAYRERADYDPLAAFRRAAASVAGQALAEQLEAGLPWLHDAGRQAVGDQRSRLRAVYERFAHPAAQEIVAWLDATSEDASAPTSD